MGTFQESADFQSRCEAIFQEVESQAPPVLMSVSRKSLFRTARRIKQTLAFTPAAASLGLIAAGTIGSLWILPAFVATGAALGSIAVFRLRRPFGSEFPSDYELGGKKGLELSHRMLDAAGVGVEIDNSDRYQEAQSAMLHQVFLDFPRLQQVCARWMEARGSARPTTVEATALQSAACRMEAIPEVKAALVEKRRQRAMAQSEQLAAASPLVSAPRWDRL